MIFPRLSRFFWVFVLLGSLRLAASVQEEDPHFSQGVEFQQAGKFEQAIQEYELSLKSRVRFPVLTNLGAAYAQLGRYEEAITRYEQALQLAPAQPGILLNLGLAYYKVGNLEKAVSLFAEVVKSQPDNLQARILLADSFFRRAEYKEVIALLEPFWEQNKGDLSIAYLLGTSYLRDHQVEKGQSLVDHILRQGESAEAHLLLGTSFFEAFDNKAAIAEFERALEVNPDLPLVHTNLAQALLRLVERFLNDSAIALGGAHMVHLPCVRYRIADIAEDSMSAPPSSICNGI